MWPTRLGIVDAKLNKNLVAKHIHTSVIKVR